MSNRCRSSCRSGSVFVLRVRLPSIPRGPIKVCIFTGFISIQFRLLVSWDSLLFVGVYANLDRTSGAGCLLRGSVGGE